MKNDSGRDWWKQEISVWNGMNDGNTLKSQEMARYVEIVQDARRAFCG